MSDSYKVYASKEYVENKIEESRVQPDWNQNDPNAADYVKNRTHWAETALVEEVPETEITMEVGNGFASANMDASVSPSATEEGEIRTIVFDGKEYECAMYITEGPTFGNGALIPADSQFPDTGEPFMYMYMPDGGGMVLTRDTAPTTHTIACYKKKETVHTIDPKFLPASGSSGGGGDGSEYAFVIGVQKSFDSYSGIALSDFSVESGSVDDVIATMQSGKPVKAAVHAVLDYGDGEVRREWHEAVCVIDKGTFDEINIRFVTLKDDGGVDTWMFNMITGGVFGEVTLNGSAI